MTSGTCGARNGTLQSIVSSFLPAGRLEGPNP